MSHLHSLFTNSTYIKENWALDGFESRMALDLRGVGSINHAHAHSMYNLSPIKKNNKKQKKKKKKKKKTYNLGHIDISRKERERERNSYLQ